MENEQVISSQDLSKLFMFEGRLNSKQYDGNGYYRYTDYDESKTALCQNIKFYAKTLNEIEDRIYRNEFDYITIGYGK